MVHANVFTVRPGVIQIKANTIVVFSTIYMTNAGEPLIVHYTPHRLPHFIAATTHSMCQWIYKVDPTPTIFDNQRPAQSNSSRR